MRCSDHAPLGHTFSFAFVNNSPQAVKIKRNVPVGVFDKMESLSLTRIFIALMVLVLLRICFIWGEGGGVRVRYSVARIPSIDRSIG